VPAVALAKPGGGKSAEYPAGGGVARGFPTEGGPMTNPIQMQKYLSGVDYPCDRDGLVDHARSNGAEEDVLNRLQEMPDRQYDGPNAVSAAYSDAG
jgi:hypothetical protein